MVRIISIIDKLTSSSIHRRLVQAEIQLIDDDDGSESTVFLVEWPAYGNDHFTPQVDAVNKINGRLNAATALRVSAEVKRYISCMNLPEEK